MILLPSAMQAAASTLSVSGTMALSTPAPTIPASRGPTDLTTLTAPTLSKFLEVCSCNGVLNSTKALIFRKPRNSKTSNFLTRCSTKPNTDRENATEEGLIAEPSFSKSAFQEQVKGSPKDAILSSNASFSRGLVFNLGPENSWDSDEVGSPVVKRYLSDDEERWYMWYHGRSRRVPGLDSVGLAISNNGIHWERGNGAVKSSADAGLVMRCSNDWWAFDTQSIRPCEVVIMSSAKVRANNAVYWLYYTGYSSEEVGYFDDSLGFSLENPEKENIHVAKSDESNSFKVFRSLPGLAMSQDGRHWARIEGEHHSGALFDVGSEGEWDSLFIASPQVVFHGSGDLRMYYHSFDVEKGHFAVGLARSRDGMRWVKLGKVLGAGGIGAFDEAGVINASVVRNRKDGKYLMAYEGVAFNGRRSIGMAVSSDGLKGWKRIQEGPVLKQSEGRGWDSEGVGSPCLVQMEGDTDEWRLYYRGIGNEGRTGIGMAVFEGSEFGEFRRWKGFQL